ncbi:MAG: FAD-dependent oxidoreductase, partial [Thermocrispum sp.]
MTADYDVVVIGGGAAGLAAARSAVRAGVHTMLVTDGPPGGDCTFTGCVPSKTLIEAAGQGLPFDKAMARVREAVARIAATEDEQALRTEGIDVLRGRARLGAPNQIEVDRQVLGARRIVIATGAKPVLPAVPGLDSVESLTTDTIFGLTVPPGSLAVLGGGAVGCELAQAFARLGVRVTLVEATDRLLPDHDPEVSTLLAEVLTADGVSVHTGAPAESVQGDSHA